MAKNIIFELTEEQQDAINAVHAELKMGDGKSFVVVEAPAGAGKTATAKALMRSVQEEDEKALSLTSTERRKIGYFVFNTDMKSEMEYRSKLPDSLSPDDCGILNTEFFTFHGFMKKQTESNPKFKKFFYNEKGEYLVDGEKEGYGFKEVSNSGARILEVDKIDNFSAGFLKDMMGAWLKNTEGLVQFSKRISSEVYPQEGEERKIKIDPDTLSVLESTLYQNRGALLQRAGLSIHAEPTKDLLLALYLMHGIDDVMNINKYSHDGYYKKIFLLAKKNNIDLFEEFDFLIIDEAQDVDPLVKELFEMSNRVKVLFGDRSQSIYGFRGAINFMEEVSSRDGAVVCPVTASFRFPNDVSVFSWKLLEKQENFSGVKLVSSHVPSISSIDEELKTIEEATDEFVERITEKIIGEDFDNRFGVDIENAPKREVQKFLSNNTAFIARNNATLLPTVFELVSRLKEVHIQVEDKKTKEMKSVELIDYINISLTKKISSEFKAIQDCTFNRRTRNKIQERTGIPFYEYKKDKSLDDFLSDINVTSVLADDKNYAFLLNPKYKEYYDFLMREMSSRDKVNLPSSSLGTKELKNIQQRNFTAEIRKEIETALKVKYKLFKEGHTLSDMLDIPEVRSILESKKDYKFLFNPEERKEFDDFCERTNAVMASSKFPTVLVSTIHGTKGNQYENVVLNSDIMKEDDEGRVPDDEIKLAYVAITRAQKKIYFVENEGDLSHPMHNFYIEHKDEISEELKKDFNYTFPKKVSLRIFKENDLFFHEVKRDNQLVGLFGQEKPMSIVHLAYSSSEDEPLFFRFRSHDRGKKERMKYISMDGEDMLYADVPQDDKVNYRIGTPTHRTEEQEGASLKKLNSQKKTKKIMPKV